MFYSACRYVTCLMVGYLLVALVTAQPQPTRSGKRSSKSKQPQPLTIEELVRYVGFLQPTSNPHLTLEQLAKTISNQKLGFTCTDPIRDQLIAAGAPKQILTMAECPTPSPTVSLSSVLVSCLPAECEVFSGGRLMALTEKGQYRIPDLPPQAVEIGVRKEGYQSESKKTDLRSGQEAKVSFTLQPTLATRKQWGMQHFISALQALGGPTGIAEASATEVQGTATVTKGNQKNSREFTATVMLPDTVSATFKVPPGVCKATLAGENNSVECYEIKKKKKQRMDTPADLQMIVQTLKSSQLVSVLGRSFEQNSVITADSDQIPQDTPAFSAVTENGKYVVVFDADHLPRAIMYQDNKAATYTEWEYFDFRALGQGKCPRRIVVKNGRDTPDVFEFQFELVKKAAPAASAQQ